MAPSMPPTDPATATAGQDAAQTPGASTSTAASAAAQALAVVSNQTNFTPDQVQLLLQSFAAALSGQNNGGQPPAAITATPVTVAAFPAFTFAPPAVAPASASLLDLFPTIDGAVLLEIARLEFKPNDLYELDTRHKERASCQVLELSSGVVLVRDQAPRDYPSFYSLYIPLNTYFNMLTGFVSTGGDTNTLYHLPSSTTGYLAWLTQFSQEYQWAAMVVYHFDFHYK